MTVIVDIITGTGQDLRWATLYNLFANSLIQNGGSSTQFVAWIPARSMGKTPIFNS